MAPPDCERRRVVGRQIIFESLLQIFGFRQHRSDSVEKLSSLGGQLHALIEPKKKLYSEFFLQKF